MAQGILLDTCAALWLINGDPMSAASRDSIRKAQSRSLGIHVSPISAWEIATLVARNRLRLTMNVDQWFNALLALPGIRLAPMPPEILIASASLPGAPPRDPADRIIAATARAHRLTVITRDGELIPYAQAGHIRVIAC